MWQEEDVCTRCLYTICRGLSAQHLVGVSMVYIIIILYQYNLLYLLKIIIPCQNIL